MSGVAAIQWAQLLPPGPRIETNDGRSFSYNTESIIAAFKANQGPLVVDYEHAQDRLAPKGDVAPAAGWIVDMENRDGSVWGKIEWTEKAAGQIRAKEYRYLSPSIRHTSDGTIANLQGAGLVNRPALKLEPLSLETNGVNVSVAARSIAQQAQFYQQEQAALGRSITVYQAVAAIVAGSETATFTGDTI